MRARFNSLNVPSQPTQVHNTGIKQGSGRAAGSGSILIQYIYSYFTVGLRNAGYFVS